MASKRMYNSEFLNLGFTHVTHQGVLKPQCVICGEVLSNESFKKKELKRHLEGKHNGLVNKNRSFFERKEQQLKRQRLDAPTNPAVTGMQQATLASYLVSWRIARTKKPYTIGEKLIKPAALDLVQTTNGNEFAKKIEHVPLLHDTVKKLIQSMSCNIKSQVIAAIKESGQFSLWLYESTDLSDDTQLMTYVRYQGQEDMEEEFLFCRPLQTTITGEDIFMMVDSFFREEGLNWKQCYSNENYSLSQVQDTIGQHMSKLVTEFDHYIPENAHKYSWIRNPFNIEAEDLPEEISNIHNLQEQLIEIQSDEALHYDFKRQHASLSSFWIKVYKEKPILGGEARKALLPFATTYLCEAGFSALTVTKTKYRNSLQPEDDQRCSLTSKSPRFEELVNTLQCQGSH
ncbi:SCAN domain-containing protein 3-like [Portunus trituberculatus]|uniref:SCAN domain-containing protein 3-like n=1 Tax=Portunus trituberculatus TaxID=210409 RepID=UPI001E1CCC62|nr:SCAN domain-containing protein 3-like [Portunus trituberculatus]